MHPETGIARFDITETKNKPMYDEDQILEKTKWLDTLIAIGAAILIMILGALLMRWVEFRFATAHAQSPSLTLTESVNQVSVRVYDGYLVRDPVANTDYARQNVLPISRTTPVQGATHSFLNSLLGINTAEAAELPTYAADLVSQSHDIVRALPGRAFTVTVEFKNTGSATWTNAGDHFIALNVSGPAGRTSAFQHQFWPLPYRPARLQQASVKPGQTGRFVFALQTPIEPGQYLEHFSLVAEDLEWITGGDVQLTITVPKPYQAGLVATAANTINMPPGSALTFWADFKNTGSATWTNTGDHFIALNVSGPAGRTSAFHHQFWPLPYRPARLLQSAVPPGSIGRFQFAIQAPDRAGLYVERFGLVAENIEWISGGSLRLPIQVGDIEPLGQTDDEPLIRVGITSGLARVNVTSATSYQAKTATGALLATLSAGTLSSVRYDNGTYSLSLPGKTKKSQSPIRFVPSQGGIMEIANYENRPGWNLSLNDNAFRGVIEVNYAAETNRLWVINELPLESYLRGIAETSNSSPVEFQKALMVAARSYAYYHIQRNTKHAAEHFTVDATYDQVYRGYGFEQRSPTVTAAVKATRGKVVSYQGKPVITPYYSHSDGRTRSWEEVWAGDPKPWLVSVPDPWCNGLDLFGHGVGMSALGAIGQANEGKTYPSILKYYYTGTKLLKLY